MRTAVFLRMSIDSLQIKCRAPPIETGDGGTQTQGVQVLAPGRDHGYREQGLPLCLNRQNVANPETAPEFRRTNSLFIEPINRGEYADNGPTLLHAPELPFHCVNAPDRAAESGDLSVCKTAKQERRRCHALHFSAFPLIARLRR